MDEVFIQYKKAKIELIFRKIYNFIAERIKGGSLFEQIKFHAYECYQNKELCSLKKLFRSMFIYCFSGAVARKLFGKSITDDILKLSEITLTETNKILFHWAPKEKLNNILKEGLLPGKSHDYVYITDDSEFIKNHGYLYYKTLNYNKKEMTFVKIAINTSKLAEKHMIFKTIRSHEYIVEKVPPDCFINY
ncbi:MAG: hypothetical protein II567_05695 [Candidatus Riflebacteria bacterium]|nr:hypothetical protein [Candidatus Riflebacteria bacterium]